MRAEKDVRLQHLEKMVRAAATSGSMMAIGAPVRFLK